jgi:hypothetical protein
MQNIIRLIASQPQILIDHAEAYSDLLSCELVEASGAWKMCFIYSALTLMMVCIALALSGVALMLWATTPADQIHSLWILWFVPILALCGTLFSAKMAHLYTQRGAFKYLKSQIKADMAMLREVRPNA